MYTKHWKEHTQPHFEAGHRQTKTREYFKKINADIFCLQEVETQDFDSNYLGFFRDLGYDGVLQETTHIVGVATFFKKAKFDLLYHESRSRALIGGLETKPSSTGPQDDESHGLEQKGKDEVKEEEEEEEANKLTSKLPVQIANVHLEGHHSREKRSSQIKSLLKR